MSAAPTSSSGMFDDRLAYHAPLFSPDPLAVSPYAVSEQHSSSAPQQLQAELAYHHHRHHQQQQQHRLQSQHESIMDDLVSFHHDGEVQQSAVASVSQFPLVPSTGSLSSLVSASSSSPFRQQADTSPAHAHRSSSFSSSAGRLQPSARGDVDYELFDIFQMASTSFDAEDARAAAFFQHSLPTADTELRLSPLGRGQQQQQQLPFVSPLHPSLSSSSLASAGPQHLPTLQPARAAAGRLLSASSSVSAFPHSQPQQPPFLTYPAQAEFVSNHQPSFLPLSPAAAPPPPPPSLQALTPSSAASPHHLHAGHDRLDEAMAAKRESYSPTAFLSQAAQPARSAVAPSSSSLPPQSLPIAIAASPAVLPLPSSASSAPRSSSSFPQLPDMQRLMQSGTFPTASHSSSSRHPSASFPLSSASAPSFSSTFAASVHSLMQEEEDDDDDDDDEEQQRDDDGEATARTGSPSMSAVPSRHKKRTHHPSSHSTSPYSAPRRRSKGTKREQREDRERDREEEEDDEEKELGQVEAGEERAQEEGKAATMDEAHTGTEAAEEGGEGGGGGGAGDRKERLSTRLARKAELARASRKRRKMYLQELEQKVQRLTARVEELQRRLRKLHSGGGLGREERVRKEQQSAIKERLTQLVAMSQQLSSSRGSSDAAQPAVVAAAATPASPLAPSASPTPSASGPSSPLTSSASSVPPSSPPSSLLPSAVLPPPQPVLPPEYQHELQELVTRFVYNCFTADTQLLTADGFLFVDDIRHRLQQTGSLRIGCYNAADCSIEYHPIGLQQLVDRSGLQQLVRFHAPDSQVDLTVTAAHDMFAAVDARGFLKLPARSLLDSVGDDEEPRQLRFLACAAAGVSRPLQDWRSLPFVAALGLTSRDQHDAFLLLYGCFLRTGRLDARQQSISLMVSSSQAWDCLDDVFQRRLLSVLPVLARGAGGEQDSMSSSSLHGVCITPRAASASLLGKPGRAFRLYRIRSTRWWRFFAALCAQQSDGPPLPLTALLASPASEEAQSSVASPSHAYDAIAASSQLQRAAAAQAEDGLSTPRLASWALRQLDMRSARQLVHGLQLADWQAEGEERSGGSGHLYVSSVLLRDELQVLLLHAGYSCSFTLHARRGWRLDYSCDAREAQPLLDCQRDVSAELRDCRVWCVTVPQRDQLIVARRVLRVDGSGAVLAASRPVVSGNSRERQGHVELHFDRVAACLSPGLQVRFAMWGLDQSDEFYSTQQPGLWSSLMQGEIGLEQRQMDWLLAKREAMHAERKNLQTCELMLRETRNAISLHLHSLHGHMDDLLSIMTPLQLAKFYLWVDNNQWTLSMLNFLFQPQQ